MRPASPQSVFRPPHQLHGRENTSRANAKSSSHAARRLMEIAGPCRVDRAFRILPDFAVPDTAGFHDINLSFLSTSAPAVSFRGDPSVSRRGTCDRKICTKPLARRTRCSYGFCMRDWRFVRRWVGLSGVVKDVGKSVGRSEEAVGCG
jgi:hypothetical protein